ncbi:MAG: thiamine pyrophosphate-dependent dehydrogenase E1 component subunit alpha [Deltaproteobacteria bacterium]|nr:thiamine pyrophosphate-dependent dehydrogenase E1 component subunit alpha [Deltaproteobacteria bacterium]
MDILEFYKKALTIRFFEEKVDWLFSRGLLGGTTHLCIGQEATAVGVVGALRQDDYIVSTHRGHGHLIAKGADITKIFSELLGKREGYCKGRGGTQHLCVMELNFLGTNGITGGGLPIAAGAALSIKLSGEDRIAVCFFGEGASNQGTFHESLNMASIWNLPILFVCENNMYAMSTRFSDISKFDDVALRAASFGIPSVIIDGMDAGRVFENTKKIAEKIRQGGGPALIEAKTYRFCGHSKSDARLYRTREEEAAWKQKDPLPKMELKLLEVISQGEIEVIKRSIKASVDDAYEVAVAGEDPGVEEALEGAYAQREDLLPQGNI